MGLPFGPIVVSSICYYLLGAASNLMNGPLQACFLVMVYVRTVLFIYLVLFFFLKDFFFFGEDSFLKMKIKQTL